MHVGLVILPSDRWKEARRQWEWADAAGFTTAWTYDHIRWGGMPDGPWHSAVPVLAAAAGATERIKLGTLVATPNFRHPVTLAREAITLDDLSDGRLELGLGPGSEGFDAERAGPGALVPGGATGPLRGVPRGAAPDRRGRADGTHLHADGALRRGGGTQHPGHRDPAPPADHRRRWREGPAAGGDPRAPLGHDRAHRAWPPHPRGDPRGGPAPARRARRRLRGGRAAPSSSIGKVLLWTPDRAGIDSPDQYEELSAPYAALGFDQFVLHHPAQTGPYGGSITAFEEIAARHAAG